MEDVVDMALGAPGGAPGAGSWGVAEGGERSEGYSPGSPGRPVAEDPMESAIAQLRLAWSLKDPDVTADRWIASAEWPFRAMALALEARRRVLWGRLSALGAARMQAQGEALGTVLALARRLPRGMAPTRGAGWVARRSRALRGWRIWREWWAVPRTFAAMAGRPCLPEPWWPGRWGMGPARWARQRRTRPWPG